MKSNSRFLFNFSKKIFLFLIAVSFFCFPKSVDAQFYQGYQMTFGKSRVQYNDFFWTFYRLKRYDVYFYLGGKEFADYTAQVATEQIEQIEKLLDYKFDGRIQFIIFNSLSDMRQSNIGIPGEDSYNIGGTTKFVTNKVFITFNGSHQDIIRQIRAGVAQIMVNQILYGGDIKDAIQNAALLTLPDWYMSGLVSFIAENWNTDIDNRVKDGIITEKYKKFNRLSGDEALYAGHSVWAYIVELYGEQSLSNILYMTRVNRSIESGFMFVLGVSSKGLSRSWYDFYLERYKDEQNGRTLPEKEVLKSKRPMQIITQPKISPDGKALAFVTNETGKYKINLLDLTTGKKKVLRREGYKTVEHKPDYSFPLLAWMPDGKTLSSIRTWKGKIILTQFTLEDKKKIETPILNFEKITDFSYSDNGQSFVMSAMQKGKPDIFVFNLRTRVPEQITNDNFDDFSPRFIQNSSKVVFASNRINDTLSVSNTDSVSVSGQTDIFIYDYKSKSKVLKRITFTPEYSETNPTELDSSHLMFLGDENGIRNRFVAHLDSALSYVDTTEHYRDVVNIFPSTNYSRGVLWQDANRKSGKFSEILYTDGKYKVFVSSLPNTNPTSGENLLETPYRKRFLLEKAQRIEFEKNKKLSNVQKPVIISVESPQKDETKSKPASDSTKIDINNYFFQDEFSYRKNKKPEKKSPEKENITSSTPVDSIVREPKKPSNIWMKRNYNTAFNPSYLQVQIDNSLISPTYDLFTGGGPVAFGTGLNFLARISTNDLFEDYKVTGAIRVSGDFNTIGYFMSAENLKGRIDKQLTFYREGKTHSFSNGLVIYREHINELKYNLKYPFSETISLRSSIGFRTDRMVRKSTDAFSLALRNKYAIFGLGKLEFVFDNTRSRGLNLLNGIRLKVFGEVFQINVPPVKERDTLKLSIGKPFYVLGTDVRYYQKIHREIVWANRFAASASLGPEKVIYYLGGTDNWFNPKFDYSIPIDNQQPYIFQGLATNLRGFPQNIRNGSNFAVINSELRFPVFKYFMARPIKSDFVKNFQLVGFGDVGMAWVGFSPFDSTNSLNSQVIKSPPITVTLINQRQPIVGGYGFGIRSRILGYFARLDWSWGVEDGEVKSKIIYFSLSLDF